MVELFVEDCEPTSMPNKKKVVATTPSNKAWKCTVQRGSVIELDDADWGVEEGKTKGDSWLILKVC